jgi:putative lipoprotein
MGCYDERGSEPMNRLVTMVALSFLTLLAGCAHQAQKPPVLHGVATCPQAATLPEGSELRLDLSDVTRISYPPLPVASRVIPVTGQGPISFELPYNRHDIDWRKRYELNARIVSGDQVLFVADKPLPVFTNGAPSDNIQVPMKPARAGANR